MNGEITRSCGSESVNHFLNFWKFFFGRVETQTLIFQWFMVIYTKKIKIEKSFYHLSKLSVQPTFVPGRLRSEALSQSSVPGELKLTEVVFPSSLICQYCVLYFSIWTAVQQCDSSQCTTNHVTDLKTHFWYFWCLYQSVFKASWSCSLKSFYFSILYHLKIFYKY